MVSRGLSHDRGPRSCGEWKERQVPRHRFAKWVGLQTPHPRVTSSLLLASDWLDNNEKTQALETRVIPR